MSGLLASLALIGGFIAFVALLVVVIGLVIFGLYRTGDRRG